MTDQEATQVRVRVEFVYSVVDEVKLRTELSEVIENADGELILLDSGDLSRMVASWVTQQGFSLANRAAAKEAGLELLGSSSSNSGDADPLAES